MRDAEDHGGNQTWPAWPGLGVFENGVVHPNILIKLIRCIGILGYHIWDFARVPSFLGCMVDVSKTGKFGTQLVD